MSNELLTVALFFSAGVGAGAVMTFVSAIEYPHYSLGSGVATLILSTIGLVLILLVNAGVIS
jgi:hypothetical protein